jgi:hypothetical protein
VGRTSTSRPKVRIDALIAIRRRSIGQISMFMRTRRREAKIPLVKKNSAQHPRPFAAAVSPKNDFKRLNLEHLEQVVEYHVFIGATGSIETYPSRRVRHVRSGCLISTKRKRCDWPINPIDAGRRHIPTPGRVASIFLASRVVHVESTKALGWASVPLRLLNEGLQ